MATRSEQKEARRKQILEAALELFVKKGFAETRISDIADDVGMSVGLLFHYFDSKERLYEELLQMGMARSQALFAQEVSNPLAFFENAARFILESAKRNPVVPKMFVLIYQAANHSFLPEEQRAYIKWGIFERSAEVIRAGQREGSIREGDPLALSVAFWGAIQGICHSVALESRLSIPDGDWIVDLVRKR